MLTLLLLELGLRAAGHLFYAAQDRANQAALAPGEQYRILCIGESTTAFGGKRAYPILLERRLNQRADGMRFSVANAGMPAAGSGDVLSALPEFLERFRPHVVVAMVGINDALPAVMPRGWLGLEELGHLRIVKLVRLLWMSLRAPMAPPAPDGEIPEDSEAAIRRRLAQDPDDEEALAGLIRIYRRAKRPGDAEAILRQLIHDFPAAKAPRRQLLAIQVLSNRLDEATAALDQAEDGGGDAEERARMRRQLRMAVAMRSAHEGRRDEARAEIERVLEEIPASAVADRVAALAGLSWMSETAGDHATAEAYRREASALRQGHWNPETRRNYLDIVRLVQSHGIPIVAVQYPLRDVAELRAMLAGTTGVVFVGNDRTFRQAVKEDGYDTYFSDAFAGDFGHTTPQGSLLLADNVAKGILRHVLPRMRRRRGGTP